MGKQQAKLRASQVSDICLLVENSKDRQLIKQCLGDSCRIVTASDFLDGSRYDLWISDTKSFRKHFWRYKKHREQSQPEFLPSLLIAQKNDFEHLDESCWQLLDDVITVPTEPKILKSRIKLLLRTKAYSSRLKRGNKEKKTLLNEVHHRVKNNLALIKGLLELEGQKLDNPQAREALTDSRMRILSISKVHELLYQQNDLSKITFADYIEELIKAVNSTFANTHLDINYVLNIEDLKLSISQAIPCGIIINELLTNSVNHAFANTNKGEIGISMTESNGKVRFEYYDDGKKLPEDFDIDSSSGMGFAIIKTLVKQIKGALNTVRGPESKFLIEFEKDGYSGFY